jgi:FkbM family methyltransferase
LSRTLRFFFSPSALLHEFYHYLGRSQIAVRGASAVRNQLDAVIRYHFADSYHDAEQMDARLLEVLGPSISSFVDVGANVGRWTLALLKHAPTARGLLLEPGSVSSELERAVAGFRSVTLRVAAAGAREGVASFFESSGASEGSTLVEGAHLPNSLRRPVQVVTIDAELNRLGWNGVDVMKVDTEGFDLDVLRGAEGAIQRRSIRWIQFEYNVHWRIRGATLLAAAQVLKGYELYLVQDGLRRANLTRYGEYFAYSNYLAVRPDSLDLLKPLLRGRL